MKHQSRSATAANAAYYNSMPPGLEDYWNLMAAPRFRANTLCRLILGARPSAIVELGCGNGRLLVELGERGFAGRRLGIDLSENRISANKALVPAVDWLNANLELPGEVPVAERGTFDAVVACELIEHVTDPARLLASARSLAMPDTGTLFLSTQSGPVGATERFVGHQRHFSAREMDPLLRSAGWEPLRIWNTGFPFHDLSKWIASRRPVAMIERFNDRAYGPTEKAVCLVLRSLFKLNSSTRGAQLFAIARAR